MKNLGKLAIKLEYDEQYIHGAHLFVQILGLDEHLRHYTEFDRIPAGVYKGILTMYPTNGRLIKQNIVLTVVAEKTTVHTYSFFDMPQDVVIRPVDAKDKTIVAAEIKIENLDSNFRPVRNSQGVPYTLKPGKYRVKVVLPDLQIKTFELDISEKDRLYTLPVEEKDNSRREPRVQISIPVAYKTSEGKWFSTKSLNLSSTGICLIQDPASVKDDQVFVRLLVPVSETPVECYAKVRWSKHENTEQPQLGLELLLPEATKFSMKKWLTVTSNNKKIDHNFIRS